jgi:hypothetical protein
MSAFRSPFASGARTDSGHDLLADQPEKTIRTVGEFSARTVDGTAAGSI